MIKLKWIISWWGIQQRLSGVILDKSFFIQNKLLTFKLNQSSTPLIYLQYYISNILYFRLSIILEVWQHSVNTLEKSYFKSKNKEFKKHLHKTYDKFTIPKLPNKKFSLISMIMNKPIEDSYKKNTQKMRRKVGSK